LTKQAIDNITGVSDGWIFNILNTKDLGLKGVNASGLLAITVGGSKGFSWDISSSGLDISYSGIKDMLFGMKRVKQYNKVMSDKTGQLQKIYAAENFAMYGGVSYDSSYIQALEKYMFEGNPDGLSFDFTTKENKRQGNTIYISSEIINGLISTTNGVEGDINQMAVLTAKLAHELKHDGKNEIGNLLNEYRQKYPGLEDNILLEKLKQENMEEYNKAIQEEENCIKFQNTIVFNIANIYGIEFLLKNGNLMIDYMAQKFSEAIGGEDGEKMFKNFIENFHDITSDLWKILYDKKGNLVAIAEEGDNIYDLISELTTALFGNEVSAKIPLESILKNIIGSEAFERLNKSKGNNLKPGDLVNLFEVLKSLSLDKENNMNLTKMNYFIFMLYNYINYGKAEKGEKNIHGNLNPYIFMKTLSFRMGLKDYNPLQDFGKYLTEIAKEEIKDKNVINMDIIKIYNNQNSETKQYEDWFNQINWKEITENGKINEIISKLAKNSWINLFNLLSPIGEIADTAMTLISSIKEYNNTAKLVNTIVHSIYFTLLLQPHSIVNLYKNNTGEVVFDTIAGILGFFGTKGSVFSIFIQFLMIQSCTPQEINQEQEFTADMLLYPKDLWAFLNDIKKSKGEEEYRKKLAEIGFNSNYMETLLYLLPDLFTEQMKMLKKYDTYLYNYYLNYFNFSDSLFIDKEKK